MTKSEIRNASMSFLLLKIVSIGVVYPGTDKVTFGLHRSEEDGDLLELICAEIDRRIPAPPKTRRRR